MAKARRKTRQERQTEKNKERLLAALDNSLGNVTTACRKVNISRRTFYNYLNDDPDFARDVSYLEEENIDFTETKLLEAITDGNLTAIIFYLKTKGKKRGYVERQEWTGADGEKMQLAIDEWSEVPMEKRKEILAAVESILSNG